MKNKGYTLIELLGVMIILALLVSFVIPSVINSIKSSTEKKDNLVNDLIINAAEMYIDDFSNKFYGKEGKTYCISANKLIEEDYLKESTFNEENVKNKTVKVTYKDKFNYEVVKNNDCIETYYNGEVVYFDVATGKGCSEEDYDVTNSNTGYNGFKNKTAAHDTTLTDKLSTQNSCLKFYAYNDDGGDSVNLLLDHNTTAYVAWNSSGSNASGPSEVLTQLKTDTDAWVGTKIPTNYTMESSIAKYTVDYSEYKARLITAEEITQITGNTTFDVAYDGWYFFDTNSPTESDTCKYGDTSGCKYGWLYDRLSTSCTTYGCLNNGNSEVRAYWTGTAHAGGTGGARLVDFGGILGSGSVEYSDDYGVRPVIEVLKEKLLDEY